MQLFVLESFFCYNLDKVRKGVLLSQNPVLTNSIFLSVPGVEPGSVEEVLCSKEVDLSGGVCI